MPTITQCLQSTSFRGYQPDQDRSALYVLSDVLSQYKRLDLWSYMLKYVTDFDHFCKGIAESEDLVAVYMHYTNACPSSEALSKFYLALSLCPNLQILHLGLNDEYDKRFSALHHDIEYAPALTVSMGFKNLQVFSIHTFNFRSNGTDNSQSFGDFLAGCPNIHTIYLVNNGLGHSLMPHWLFAPDLVSLANALSRAPNLHTLSLQHNQLRGLNNSRFIKFYNNLTKCRALTKIIGIEDFSKQHQDMLNKLLHDNKKQIPLISEFTAVCILPPPLKQLALEYIVPQDILPLPIIFSTTPKNPLKQNQDLSYRHCRKRH